MPKPDGSSYWNTTAIFVTWGDWGGFYDHVAPWKVLVETVRTIAKRGCGFSYGRYISDFPRQGGEVPPYIHDSGSIRNFVKYAFSGFGLTQGGIGPLEWPSDDYWAPDCYLSGNCHRTDCLHSFFDFLDFRASPGPFVPVTIFVALSPRSLCLLLQGERKYMAVVRTNINHAIHHRGRGIHIRVRVVIP
jgi:hypothetical protein